MTPRGRRGARVGGAARASVAIVAIVALAAAALGACGATRGVILGEIAGQDAALNEAGHDAVEEEGCPGCPRSVTLSGDASSPEQGQPTATPFTDTCPGDQAVIGYQGFLTGPEVGLILVGGIQTLCGQLVVGETGQMTAVAGAVLPMEGTSQDSPWTQTCPADEVVVGFSGRSGADVDQVAFECAPWTAPVVGAGETLSMGATVTLPPAGGDGGIPFQSACPAGQMARGTVGQAGDWVNELGLVCGTPSIAAAADGGP